MEEWRDVPGYEGRYKVSSLGRVISQSKGWSEKSYFIYGGYKYQSLWLGGKEKKYKVSQLVAMAFLNHIPNGYNMVVDHINNDRLDDSLDNLQVVTARYNVSKDRGNKTSNYTGVYFCKHKKKWRSDININKKSKFIGYFHTELEAHQSYLNKLKEIEHINYEESITK